MTSESLQNQDKNSKSRSSLTDEISFKDIILNIINWFRYLVSNWLIILIVAILGGIIGFIRANRQPLLYVANSTFVLQDGAGNMGQADGLASLLGVNVSQGSGMFQGDGLLELYRTRFMLKKTLLSIIPDTKNEHVLDRYMKISGIKEAWKDSANLRNLNFYAKPKNKKEARTQDSVMTVFTNDIRFNYLAVDIDRRLNILRVEVRSTNEEFSKILNDQIVKTVNDYYIQTKTQKALENLSLMQHQTDSIKAALNGAMYKVASTTDVTINANPARQVLRLPSQRNQVDAETNRGMLNELVRNVELAKMALRKETPLIQILDEATFPLEHRRESRAKAIIISTLIATIIAVIYYTIILLYRKVMK
ncbi:MAG: hypothetical protein ACRYGB_12535 [Janthinobacterium lividum]